MLKALKIPAPYDAFIKFEDLMYNAAKNLASLAMLAPSAAGYPGDPVSDLNFRRPADLPMFGV
jgi:hypothetical protein